MLRKLSRCSGLWWIADFVVQSFVLNLQIFVSTLQHCQSPLLSSLVTTSICNLSFPIEFESEQRIEGIYETESLLRDDFGTHRILNAARVYPCVQTRISPRVGRETAENNAFRFFYSSAFSSRRMAFLSALRTPPRSAASLTSRITPVARPREFSGSAFLSARESNHYEVSLALQATAVRWLTVHDSLA